MSSIGRSFGNGSIVALGVGVLLVHEPVQMSDLIAVAAILIGVYVLQRARAASAAAA